MADRTASQLTIYMLLNSILSCFRDIGLIGVTSLTFRGHSIFIGRFLLVVHWNQACISYGIRDIQWRMWRNGWHWHDLKRFLNKDQAHSFWYLQGVLLSPDVIYIYIVLSALVWSRIQWKWQKTWSLKWICPQLEFVILLCSVMTTLRNSCWDIHQEINGIPIASLRTHRRMFEHG